MLALAVSNCERATNLKRHKYTGYPTSSNISLLGAGIKTADRLRPLKHIQIRDVTLIRKHKTPETNGQPTIPAVLFFSKSAKLIQNYWCVAFARDSKGDLITPAADLDKVIRKRLYPPEREIQQAVSKHLFNSTQGRIAERRKVLFALVIVTVDITK